MARTMKIAIVDDEQDMRQSISQWLALSGFDTETYASAEDALKVIGPDWPGVVVSDIRMPGMTGPDLAEIAARLRPHLRIVLVSGYINVRPGGWSYLSKPYDLSALKRLVGSPS